MIWLKHRLLLYRSSVLLKTEAPPPLVKEISLSSSMVNVLATAL